MKATVVKSGRRASRRTLTVWSCALLLAACTGSIGDSPLDPAPYRPELVAAPLPLAPASGFADERGGGLFVDSQGRVARLRLDGTMARIDNHPGNQSAPGKALRLYPAGPFSALVVAEQGLYVAESGWLIEPSWRGALDGGAIVAVALASNGVTWVAHQRGLFRIDAGSLSELKVAGASLSGLTALAAAPAPDGAAAVWFAQGSVVSYARQTARTSYEVWEHSRGGRSFEGNVVALAGLSAAPGAGSQLWLATDEGLYQQAGSGWVPYGVPAAPSALVAAGRYLWLHAGASLYRYTADQKRWSVVEGLPAPPALLLAAEAAGSAWLRVGEQSFVLSPGPVPRLLGLFEGMRVYGSELQVQAQFPAAAAPDVVTFSLDGTPPRKVEQKREQAQPGEGALATLDFSLGGRDGAGQPRAYSLSGLSDGLHTLTISAKFAGRELERSLHFELRGASSAPLSFARDVLPIFEARCAKCHTKGPGHTLATYEQWVSEKESVVAALVEQRMPADGPLDPTQLETIQRWSAGGTQP